MYYILASAPLCLSGIRDIVTTIRKMSSPLLRRGVDKVLDCLQQEAELFVKPLEVARFRIMPEHMDTRSH
jgi:hypothetical protein